MGESEWIASRKYRSAKSPAALIRTRICMLPQSWMNTMLCWAVSFSRRPGMGISRRSEEHTSELQSLMRISYAVFCLKKKIKKNITSELAQQQDITSNTTTQETGT